MSERSSKGKGVEEDSEEYVKNPAVEEEDDDSNSKLSFQVRNLVCNRLA